MARRVCVGEGASLCVHRDGEVCEAVDEERARREAHVPRLSEEVVHRRPLPLPRPALHFPPPPPPPCLRGTAAATFAAHATRRRLARERRRDVCG